MKRTIVIAGVATCLAASGLAMAQERTWGEKEVAAPKQAFELDVSTGYTQGFGMLNQGVGMPDVADAGIGVGVGAGYRINPRWSISLQGQYQELNADRGTSARGATGTLAAQYHFRPEQRLDPWAELGAGYRFLWENNALQQDTLLTHGIQLVRARVGADIRVSPDVALGPFIGADLNTFLGQEGNTIDNPRLSTFVLAGLQGRFDIGGTRTTGTAPAIAAR